MFRNLFNTIAVRFFSFAIRLLLPIRYKIVVENLEKISTSKGGYGILFLANHSSLLDGLLLGALTWPRFKAVSLVVEDYYNHPTFNWLFVATDSVCCPNFGAGSNDLKQKRLKESIDTVARYLKEGRNVIIFPSGKIKKKPREEVGGNSFLCSLFEQVVPQAIVLVRISGFWGSSFSYAREGDPPHFSEGWGEKLQQVLANGIFFMPKRKIVVHFEKVDDLPYKQGKIAMNRYLTDWYNAPFPKGEPFIYYPYYFWKKEPAVKPMEILLRQSDDLYHPVFQEISTLFNIPIENISKNKKLGMDLGLDSLDLAKLASRLETKYDLGIVALDDLDTVNDIVLWVEDIVKNHPVSLPKQIRPNPNQAGVGDLWHHCISFSVIEQFALQESEKYKQLPEQVGVLLPNSLELITALLALAKAKKRPILINWLKDVSFKTAIHQLLPNLPFITSKSFLSSLNQVDLNDLSNNFIEIGPLDEKSLSKTDLNEISCRVFDYIEDVQGKPLIKSFDMERSTYLTDLIETGKFKKGQTIAVLHSAILPEEIALNMQLLKLECSVYFLSSYRTSLHDLIHFIRESHCSVVFCHEDMKQKLQNLEGILFIQIPALASLK